MNQRMLVPAAVAVAALLAAAAVTYSSFLSPPEPPPPVATVEPTPEPTRVVSKKGGFALMVPYGLAARKKGKTVTLFTSDQSLVVTVGPAGKGRLLELSDEFVALMERTYKKVRLLETAHERVDGRKALATSGTAVNERKVKIRFVNVIVQARPRSFSITSFTAFDSDARTILPIVNTIVDGFTVLP